MSIVVTGSAGRVGSRVARRLLDEGEAVVGFDLRPAGIDHPRYREVVGAFSDPAAARQAAEGAKAVLHLGAFMSWRREDADKLWEANVTGTRMVAEAAAAAGCRRFVFASSGEVYPENVPAYQPIDEDHPLAPRTPYGLTKLLGEEIVRFLGRTGALETVILRFSHTQDAAELLDPDSFFSGPRFFLHPKIRQQQAFGNAAAVAALVAVDDGREALVLSRNENGRPFAMHITDTRDMVEGILLALRHPAAAGEVFNLGASEPVDFARALPLMAERTGLPLREVNLPGPGVHYRTANRKIRERLGFTPTWTIERMIDEAVAARSARQRS
ncbi:MULTISPECIES: NAD(P)-dependent oxidoreductase [unclassified Chelatococcus]|uniref:NAD-dependent epimerase/dehydratase family protein n=1 Tax=unclassified Chelatococcus TaxID=2638111 RepID=UPI000303C701|nr:MULTISPECIES: NAD(P)-dependent oxidoreductase [unclassified Chelatococcus]ALA19962.1 nucleoside-diphosphate sugar epimerase [Chelatococcus sp. CO-6]